MMLTKIYSVYNPFLIDYDQLFVILKILIIKWQGVMKLDDKQIRRDQQKWI